MAGSQIHSNSLISVCNPPYLKKPATPIADTSIGVHGMKYRVVSNGAKNAMPSPPSDEVISNGYANNGAVPVRSQYACNHPRAPRHYGREDASCHHTLRRVDVEGSVLR